MNILKIAVVRLRNLVQFRSYGGEGKGCGIKVPTWITSKTNLCKYSIYKKIKDLFVYDDKL